MSHEIRGLEPEMKPELPDTVTLESLRPAYTYSATGDL
jgi:hypothetical protein